jgi:F-type H+-transporting ATPase subunit delta
MTNLSSTARPYAIAAFNFARTTATLPLWKTFLASAASVAANEQVKQILNNPLISASILRDLFFSALEEPFALNKDNTALANFLSLLQANNRLNVLPEIAEVFTALYAQHEHIVEIELCTAIEISENLQQKFHAALKKRLACEIKLNRKVDPGLIGGALITIGDKVIDGSIRGKLTRLLEFSLR